MPLLAQTPARQLPLDGLVHLEPARGIASPPMRFARKQCAEVDKNSLRRRDWAEWIWRRLAAVADRLKLRQSHQSIIRSKL